jgi:DNA primase
MQVYPETNTCFCFSTNCPTHGKSLDVIDFIMYMEKTTKHQAILKAKSFLSNENNSPQELSRSAVLTRLFTYFRNGIFNSKPALDYLESRALDVNKLEVGYNTGQFHHGKRRDEHLIQSYVDVGMLKPNGKSRTGEEGYQVFAEHCTCFPLKNKVNQITGLYFRSTKDDQNQRHFFLKNRQGLYPRYPDPETRKLILTESVIDAASLLQQEEISEHYTVLALYGTNGFTQEHQEAIQELNHLEEVIFFLNGDEAARQATEKHSKTIRELRQDISISTVDVPENEDVNSLLQGHQSEIFTHLLQERGFLFSTEHKPEPTPELETNHQPEQPETPVGLDASNDEQITYKKDGLLFTLLGGMSYQEINRLQVTLKVAIEPELSPLQSFRHTLDLYNDDQVEKYCRKAAGKLETGTNTLREVISEMIDALERHRMEWLKAKSQKHKRRQLTQERKQTLIEYLEAPNLLERTNQDIARAGVIGEEKNRLVMYLVFCSRLRETPLHIISLGASGTGKTYLQEKIAELIPESDKEEITILSDNALYYFDRCELQNKLLLIEDLDGAESSLYPLKELMSKKRLSKRVPAKDAKGNLRTIPVLVEGPLSVAGTATRESIYEDNANRALLLYLDESPEHWEQILEYQRKLSSGTVNAKEEQEVKELFKDIQTLLKPVQIRNPYAEQLQIPEAVFKPLRSNAHYLAFIECVTFYHQYQRPWKTDPETGEQYIETTLEDIEAANYLMKDILLAKSDELSGACRQFFERLKTHLEDHGKQSFYAKEIRSAMRLNYATLKRYLLQLTRNSYLKVTGGDRYKKGYEYEVVDREEYEALKANVNNALDQALERIKQGEATPET